MSMCPFRSVTLLGLVVAVSVSLVCGQRGYYEAAEGAEVALAAPDQHGLALVHVSRWCLLRERFGEATTLFLTRASSSGRPWVRRMELPAGADGPGAIAADRPKCHRW